MPEYIVYERDTWNVVYAYTADTATDFPEYPFRDFSHVVKKPEIVAPPERNVTKLEYLRRFTGQERVTIRQAAKENPVLEDYLAMLEIAQDINLDDPATQGGVQALEIAGLIGEGRAAEVLA